MLALLSRHCQLLSISLSIISTSRFLCDPQLAFSCARWRQVARNIVETDWSVCFTPRDSEAHEELPAGVDRLEASLAPRLGRGRRVLLPLCARGRRSREEGGLSDLPYLGPVAA